MNKIITTLSIAALTACFAQPPGGQGGQGGPGGQGGQPPQEAISACQGKSAGDSCTMKGPRGDTVTSTCQNTPDGKYFVCARPKRQQGK